jgi:predicted aspartyl protease
MRGPTSWCQARLVVDTAASKTTLVPRVVEKIGYSAVDAFGRTSVRSVIGHEAGYLVRIAEMDLLRVRVKNLPVMVCPLAYDDIDGLIGMNFLRHFNIHISNARQMIGIELIHSSTIIE